MYQQNVIVLLLQIPQKIQYSQKLKYCSVYNDSIDPVLLQACNVGTLDHTPVFTGLFLDYMGNLVS